MASASNDDDGRERKLLEFQEICGVEDENTARQTLERFDWDLEVAVSEYLTEKEQPSVSSVERQQNEQNRIQERLSASAPSSLRRASRPPIGWFSWSWNMLLLPFRFVYSTVFDVLRFFYQFFFAGIRRPAIGDPVADVEKFISDYELKYGRQHPVFYRGTYSNALSDAKKEFKFLVVYLHCETHQDTDQFCRQTLGNQNVIDFINTNALFWACSVSTYEGFRVSQAMRETTYPFVALVALRENRMMIVVRQEGYCNAQVLTEMLVTAIADNQVYVNLARQERQQQQMNQVLRQQQEQAFQETLRQDREKERRKAEEEKQREAQIQEDLRRERDEQERLDNLRKRKEDIRQNLPPEPDSSDADLVRVKLTFPSGTKLERRFKSTDSLQLLYNVTLCHPDCPDNFSIVNGYPRRTLPCESSDQSGNNVPTFADEGLLKSVTLIVQDNEV